MVIVSVSDKYFQPDHFCLHEQKLRRGHSCLKVMRLRRDIERVSVFALTFRICLGLGGLESTEPSSERSERCEAEETRDASAARVEA